MVGFPESHGCAVESQSLFKVKESLDATVVLVFYFLKVENLSLLFLDSLDELVDICLFLVAVYLIVVLVLDDVGFLHQFIFFEKIWLEFLEKTVVLTFKSLDVLVIIC